ncbi:MAG: squalene synthase HpnC [Minwuia sp.]|uniref:squalene synthase HpnC n=1 Tax=Minwuia sp. TaxID=2493630 RepID=UPI003A893B37
MAAVETPSGKGAGDENFPVGSFLLPKPLRPHVACFYAFARAADDIADNADLTPQAKLDRLAAFDAALVNGSDDPDLAKPDRLRDSLRATGVTDAHARDLLRAFMQDAVKTRYESWDDLMAYCRLSASPVCRYLLDLHGEDPADYAVSDPLCDALQVINHLQDCQEDYREMDRVYLPLDWLAAAGETVEALDRPAASEGVRQILDQCLDGCENLMIRARKMPKKLRSRHLGAESAVIIALADGLMGELRRRDPLAERVAFGKPRMAVVAIGALLRFWAGGRG